MAAGDKNGSSSFWLYCRAKCCFQGQEPPTGKLDSGEKLHGGDIVSPSDLKTAQKKPGGWKSMPFILGNETFERLATFGLLANFMVYLMREFHLSQVVAANILNIWSGVTNFAPLLGAFISDTYVGRFKTIAFASFASLFGMVTVTLTSWLPTLHPPSNTPANNTQLAVLLTGLGLLSIGTGGIRPCSIPFGVDQFDPTTDEGIKGINSFFNWYYTSFTVVILITQTIVVYIQDSISWVIGFGIPTILMGCSVILFLVGKNVYVHVKPEGSIFSGIGQVLVAAYRKRKVKLSVDVNGGEVDGIFYDPPLKGTTVVSKLPLTHQFRFLNKAAMIVDRSELNSDGSPINQWNLSSIQRVEEVKCLIRIIPIWACGIISFTSMTQQGTFTVSQAMKMDRHLGPKFQIPPGSITVISMLVIGLWLPFYDRVLVPALRKITKHEGGITLLQRIGIGIVFSILSMVVAGLIEKDRRNSANSHPNGAPTSVMWLAPQLILMGFCEAFNVIGQIEFFNRQFPDHMRSIANSLLFCSFGCANYLSSLLITIVHKTTSGKHGRPDWLTNDINAGRLDYFYFLLAGIGVINFVYFVYCAKQYRYKGETLGLNEEKPNVDDLELAHSNYLAREHEK